jgi:hypothetical protein
MHTVFTWLLGITGPTWLTLNKLTSLINLLDLLHISRSISRILRMVWHIEGCAMRSVIRCWFCVTTSALTDWPIGPSNRFSPCATMQFECGDATCLPEILGHYKLGSALIYSLIGLPRRQLISGIFVIPDSSDGTILRESEHRTR